MTEFKKEASPIARLVGPDGKRTVGWVYAWDTSELSILWTGPKDAAAFIEPEICREMLTKAKTTTPVDVIAFLRLLQHPSSLSGS